jgi:hypothetical protein
MIALVLAAGCATTPEMSRQSNDPELQAERERLVKDVEHARLWLAKYREQHGDLVGDGLRLPPVGEGETLAVEVERLREELRIYRFWLSQYRRDGRYPIRDERPESVVIDVVSEGNEVRVRLSIGRYDGVRKGDVFHVRRGSMYVGTVRIDSVSTHAAAGVFDSQYHGPGAPPEPGDIAYPGGR